VIKSVRRPGRAREVKVSQEQRRPKQLPGSHLVAALVLAVLVPCGTTSVVARAYAACDVGINASANAFGFMALLPVLAIVYAIVHGLALVVAYAVTRPQISVLGGPAFSGQGTIGLTHAACCSFRYSW
jgi:hypothetical protein